MTPIENIFINFYILGALILIGVLLLAIFTPREDEKRGKR